MVVVAGHLSLDELEERYLSCSDATSWRHFQTIWLLAKGRSVCEVGEVVGFVPRWIDALIVFYNAVGPSALADLRRRNGWRTRLPTPEMLERLDHRLVDPPDDAGVWTSKKVAAFLAGELGLVSIGVQRGWEASEAFEKTSPTSPRKKRANIQER